MVKVLSIYTQLYCGGRRVSEEWCHYHDGRAKPKLRRFYNYY